jgi:hypothetical protein
VFERFNKISTKALTFLVIPCIIELVFCFASCYWSLKNFDAFMEWIVLFPDRILSFKDPIAIITFFPWYIYFTIFFGIILMIIIEELQTRGMENNG